jgi:NADH dehydrogenase (ubiquinone) 1 alpha subcomplex subunit 13
MVRYQRYLPKRGPSGAVLIASLFGVMTYGWIKVKQGNMERRELKHEKTWSRIYLAPLLIAETDRDLVKRLDVDLKSPVKGLGHLGVYDPDQSEPVYYTDKYVEPNMVVVQNVMPSQWWRGSKIFTKNPAYHDRPDFTAETPIGK